MPQEMPDPTSREYWDSCVFLSFIENYPGRAGDVQTLLEWADAGALEIVTSTISIAEVAYAKQEKDGGLLSDHADREIQNLWSVSSPVRLAEFHQGIAHLARRLMREALAAGNGLKPMDAIHLSTAQSLGIPVFATYDEGLDKFAGITGLEIRRPFVDQTSLDFGAPRAE